MGVYDSERNFGFGKQIAWAGREALREAFGRGHYATVAAHFSRWNRFTSWLRQRGIDDACSITLSALQTYADDVKRDVESGDMKVSYGQNLLSSVNVVLEALRGDRQIRVEPAQIVGRRSAIRTDPPTSYDSARVTEAAQALRDAGYARAAAVLELARSWGLRSREASLLDLRKAFREANRRKQITIIKGTKGGRLRKVKVTHPDQIAVLSRGVALQAGGSNIIPPEQSWLQWRNGELRAARDILHSLGIAGYHDARAAYACARYAAITGHPAPVQGGAIMDRERDRSAREDIASELGHGRINVVAEYIGGRR
jgi:hypothetical protein